MPIIGGYSYQDNSDVDRYEWSAGYVTPTAEIPAALRQWRKDAIKDREFFIGCGMEEDARHQMKLQRACKLMIPWFGEPDKGQKAEEPTLWPVELAPELDEISRRIELNYG